MNLITRSALALALLVALPAPSLAAEFLAVVENIGRRPHAALDVAVDTRNGAGVNVDFRVYDVQGVPLAQFFVPANSRGFASTESFGNLFELSGGQPMLVRAITVQGALLSGAMLNVTSSRGPALTLGVFPYLKLDGSLSAPGRLFSIAIGSFRTARLLIAGVSGGDTSVDVYRGTDGAPGQGIYYNPKVSNFAHWRIDLTQDDWFSNLVVRADSLVIVQLVIDDGKVLRTFMVPPSA